MPHVILKIASGYSERKKQSLADALTKAVSTSIDCDEASVSVSVQDVEEADWTEQVYGPEIVDKLDTLYKRPGYGPLAQSHGATPSEKV